MVPTLKDSLTTPAVRRENDDALLTCVVQNQSNFTLMWKKAEKDKAGPRILTANGERVTSDERFSVLHEPGGQVYVLLVKNVTVKDQGMYVCEVNSDPAVRSFHKLLVLSGSLQPPGGDLSAPGDEEELMASAGGVTAVTPTTVGSGPDSMSVWGYSTERPVEHDYTDCCRAGNVTLACHSFCNLKNILDGTTGGRHNFFFFIAKCYLLMATTLLKFFSEIIIFKTVSDGTLGEYWLSKLSS